MEFSGFIIDPLEIERAMDKLIAVSREPDSIESPAEETDLVIKIADVLLSSTICHNYLLTMTQVVAAAFARPSSDNDDAKAIAQVLLSTMAVGFYLSAHSTVSTDDKTLKAILQNIRDLTTLEGWKVQDSKSRILN